MDKVLAGIILLLIIGIGMLFICDMPSHKNIMAPDGYSAIMVKCSEPADCIEEAAKICPKGYQVLGGQDKQQQTTVYYEDPSIGVMLPHTFDESSGVMLIRCKL